MHHDLPHPEKKPVKEEDLRQLMEQDYMLQKGTQMHWEAFEQRFTDLVNNTGIDHDTAHKLIAYLQHCISDTRETEQRAARFRQNVEDWIALADSPEEYSRRRSKVNGTSIVTHDKINKADTKEKMAAIIGSWSFEDEFEDLDKWDWSGDGSKVDHTPDTPIPEAIKQMLIESGVPKEVVEAGKIDVEVVRLERDETGKLVPHESSLEEFDRLQRELGEPKSTETPTDPNQPPSLDDLLDRIMGKKPEKE